MTRDTHAGLTILLLVLAFTNSARHLAHPALGLFLRLLEAR